jgi:hypothetical protein
MEVPYLEGIVFCAIAWMTFSYLSIYQMWTEEMRSMKSKLTSFRDASAVVSSRKRSQSYSRDVKTRFREDHGFPKEIAEELGVVLDLFVRDFITEWFRPSVSDDEEFQKSIQNVMVDLLAGLYEQFRAAERSGSVLLLLNDALRLLRDHLYWYKQMKELAATAHPNLFYSNPDAKPSKRKAIPKHEICSAGILALREDAIVEQYRLKRHLHPACESIKEDVSYLRVLSERIIERSIRPSVPREMDCDVVRLFLREILCNTLLKNLTDMALPCEVNYWLGYALSLAKENEESLRKVFMEEDEEDQAGDGVGCHGEYEALSEEEDDDEEEDEEEAKVWRFLNPNVDESECRAMLEPYVS